MIADSILEIWIIAISGICFGIFSIYLEKIAKAFPSLFSSPLFCNKRAVNAERLLLAFCSGGSLVLAEMLYISWRLAHPK